MNDTLLLESLGETGRRKLKVRADDCEKPRSREADTDKNLNFAHGGVVINVHDKARKNVPSREDHET